MRFTSPVQIWFLDDDLHVSARYLTNDALIKSITGCYQVLIAVRFYFTGIRNKKAYKYYFDEERKTETMERLFPNWPLKQAPKFMNYSSQASKWCRKCNEHYQHVFEYMSILLDEYEYRYCKQHGMVKFIEWLSIDAPALKIPNAHLSHITLPWKVLKQKYRRKNIVDGYRVQLMSSFMGDDPFVAYRGSNRDIPDFVVKYFNLNLE